MKHFEPLNFVKNNRTMDKRDDAINLRVPASLKRRVVELARSANVRPTDIALMGIQAICDDPDALVIHRIATQAGGTLTARYGAIRVLLSALNQFGHGLTEPERLELAKFVETIGEDFAKQASAAALHQTQTAFN